MLWFFWVKSTNLRIWSFQFSINSSKYVHFWILVLEKILILIKFPFQRYINCRHLDFVPTNENRHRGNFPLFWKSEISGLVDNFAVCTKIFLEVIGPYKNVKEELSLDSKTFMRFYYRAWTITHSKGFIKRLK